VVSARGRESGVVLFLNPRSRANRQNPNLATELGAALGDAGRVVAPGSLEELRATATTLRDAPPSVIAVHGGDGTLHKVLTELGAAFGDAPLPPLAVLTGGTMNVVASSLGLREEPVVFLRTLADDARQGRPPDLMARRCLRIGDKALGFVFGNGLASNFLTEYYAEPGYGPARAARLLVETFFSALWGGPLVRRVFKRFEGQVVVDGQPLPRQRFVGINAATVREVGLGFKLNHRADDDPERFGILAIHAPPLALSLDLLAVLGGRGIAESRAFSGVASMLEVTPMSKTAEMAYTIDGDLYRAPAGETLRISVGPQIRFVRPRRALAAARVPELPSAAASDTMEGAR
jgi:diacylglycerol kinase family enzyme